MSAIKVSVLLVVTVFILAINVNGRPLFNHIYDLISPATQMAQQKTGDLLEESLSTTKSYTRRLFDNSVPNFKDTVKSKLSSTTRKDEPAERITEKDREQLNDLIKNH